MTADELLKRITPDERLLLGAVLCSDESVAHQAFRDWRDRVVIEDLDDRSHRLLPLLARRMGDLAPSDPVRDLIRGTYRLAWVKNQLLARSVASVSASLSDDGVPVIALKGAALTRYYGDWGARPMYDIDLLVPLGRVEAAFEALKDDGWIPHGGMSVDWVMSRVVPRRHSFPFSRGA